MCTVHVRSLRLCWHGIETRTKWVEGTAMRLKHQWWSGLVAAMLLGLVDMTVVAAGEQFIPILSMREGALRFSGSRLADGYIAYLTLLNARDGGINGVKLVWEFCETVFDVDRSVECYERLKTKGPTGAVFQPPGTHVIYAMIERATHDKIPLISIGQGRTDASDGRVFPYVFPIPTNYWSLSTAKIRFIGQRAGGMDQLKGLKIAHVYGDADYGRETLAILDQQAAHTALRCSTYPCNRQGLTRRRPGCGSRSPSPTGSSYALRASWPRPP